jgi:hypothetical protein
MFAAENFGVGLVVLGYQWNWRRHSKGQASQQGRNQGARKRPNLCGVDHFFAAWEGKCSNK